MGKKTGHNRSEEAALPESYRAYLDSLRQRRQSVNTLKCACFAFRHLERFLQTAGKALQDVTTDDLDRFRGFLQEQKLALMTVDVALRQVCRFFRWLAESGRIFLDPAALWSVAKPDRPLMYVPSEKDIRTLLAQPDITTAVGIRNRAFLETAYSSGARLEELCRLTIFDPDLERGLLRVLGKGRKERMLPLGKQAVRWLTTYIRDARPKLAQGKLDEERLWLGPSAQPLEGSAIRMTLRKYSLGAGLKLISPHAIRRACATHMLQRGAHPVQIQMLLGHADLKTLSQYLRLTIRDIKKMHASSNPGR